MQSETDTKRERSHGRQSRFAVPSHGLVREACRVAPYLKSSLRKEDTPVRVMEFAQEREEELSCFSAPPMSKLYPPSYSERLLCLFGLGCRYAPL